MGRAGVISHEKQASRMGDGILFCRPGGDDILDCAARHIANQAAHSRGYESTATRARPPSTSFEIQAEPDNSENID
jgi:hypothetical protein